MRVTLCHSGVGDDIATVTLEVGDGDSLFIGSLEVRKALWNHRYARL